MSDDKMQVSTVDALVRNSEALAHLNATVAGVQQDVSETRRLTREHHIGLAAKVDNLDRSVQEMRLITEKGEAARQAELKRIFDLLAEERRDRREAVTEGREGITEVHKSEREILRELIREEFATRNADRDFERKNQVATRGLVVAAGKEVWKVGGRYIVAALAFLIAAAVMKATGMSMADLLGLAGK